MMLKLPTVALVAMLLSVFGVHAEDSGSGLPKYTFSGYGTLGVVHSSENQADYTNIPYIKPNGAGYSRNWSPDVDSRLGIQLTADITPQLTAVLQVISQQRYDNTYTPTVEWANIKYAFADNFSVRLGRIAMPTFLVSDYRNVGFAIPWVRPPVDLYGQLPVTANDGVDASYRFHMGEATYLLQGSYGRQVIRSKGFSPTKANNSFGIFNTIEYGTTIAHMAYQEANLTFDSANDFFNLFRQFGPSGIAIADKYMISERPISLVSLGASHDPGKWFLMGEWSKSRFSSFIGIQTAWFVSSGYRLGKFTPYLTYSQSKKLSETSNPGLALTALPPFLVGSASALNTGLNSILAPQTGATISLGSRWDFMKNADLKMQFDHVDLDVNSSGTLINLQPGFRAGGKFNVFSATVDFLF